MKAIHALLIAAALALPAPALADAPANEPAAEAPAACLMTIPEHGMSYARFAQEFDEQLLAGREPALLYRGREYRLHLTEAAHRACTPGSPLLDVQPIRSTDPAALEAYRRKLAEPNLPPLDVMLHVEGDIPMEHIMEYIIPACGHPSVQGFLLNRPGEE